MGNKENKDRERSIEEEKDEAARDDDEEVTGESLEQKVRCESPLSYPLLIFWG